MRELIDALLNDEYGISEEAYMALVKFLETMANVTKCYNYMDNVLENAKTAEKMLIEIGNRSRATDGRFYFP